MIAYKGFTPELTSRMGDGIKKNCTFKPGMTKRAKGSKTAKEGYHCCENPFDCLGYYPLDGKNRFFVVDAAGDIDEDKDGRISCTKITLLRELSLSEFAVEGMLYIIKHPQREGWQQSYYNCKVWQDSAKAEGEGCIAIARGERPRVKGAAGAVVGMILEKDGEILAAKAVRVTSGIAGKWITINRDREVQVIEEETN